MQNHQRRRSDRQPDPASPETRVTSPDDAEADRWILRCAARVAEIEPDLPRDEAVAIARGMHDFERTRAMEPEAAADFVATEMRRAGRTRFERRGAPQG